MYRRFSRQKEFIDLSCYFADLNVEWKIDELEPLNTVLLCEGQIILKINEELYRPAEVELLYGDSKETREAIGWESKISFNELVKKMVHNDIQLLK